MEVIKSVRRPNTSWLHFLYSRSGFKGFTKRMQTVTFKREVAQVVSSPVSEMNTKAGKERR